MRFLLLLLSSLFLLNVTSCSTTQSATVLTDDNFDDMDQRCYIPLTKKLKEYYNEQKTDKHIHSLDLAVNNLTCDTEHEVSVAFVYMKINAYIETETFTGDMEGSFFLEFWCNFEFCELANMEILEVVPINQSNL